MHVRRQNGGRCVENGKAYERILPKTFQSKNKTSKIKKAVKSFIIEITKAVGKTLTATVLTSLIVIPIDLVGYANSTRPQFAIGGEWMMILFIFIGWMFVIDWILTKTKNPNGRSEKDYEYLECK